MSRFRRKDRARRFVAARGSRFGGDDVTLQVTVHQADHERAPRCSAFDFQSIFGEALARQPNEQPRADSQRLNLDRPIVAEIGFEFGGDNYVWAQCQRTSGDIPDVLISPISGIIIGKTNLPLVFAGEALFNIASYEEIDQVADNIDAYNDELDPNTDERSSDEPPLV